MKSMRDPSAAWPCGPEYGPVKKARGHFAQDDRRYQTVVRAASG